MCVAICSMQENWETKGLHFYDNEVLILSSSSV